jgi:hypothetical protein
MKASLVPALLFASILCPAQDVTQQDAAKQDAGKIVVRFVNGKNGKTVKDKRVDINLGGRGVFWQNTDSKGQIELDVHGAEPREIAIRPNQVFDCRFTRDPKIVLARSHKYSIDEIFATGVVGQNLCGAATADAVPGVLILFVRPKNFQEQKDDF